MDDLLVVVSLCECTGAGLGRSGSPPHTLHRSPSFLYKGPPTLGHTQALNMCFLGMYGTWDSISHLSSK